MTKTETPTPEVNALLLEINEGRVYKDVGPLTDLARNLEHQRDQARQELADHKEWHIRIGPETPDNSMVICPNCTSQFVATPVEVQKELIQARCDLDEAYERCAQICENKALHAEDHDDYGQRDGALDCADYIRDLKSTNPNPGEAT